MSTPSTNSLSLLLVLTLAALAGCRSARADQRPNPKKDYAGAAAPSGSASAPPPEPEPKPVDGKKPWAPSFAAIAWPDRPSDPPAKEEWKTAAEAPEVRITQPGCKARRIREWYRLECGFARWNEMISGAREGVSFGCAKERRDEDGCSETWIIFPARRGDRRAFEMFSWGKWGPSPDAIATEQFLEGDDHPSISIQGIRWSF